MYNLRSRIEALRKKIRDNEKELVEAAPFHRGLTKREIFSALRTGDRSVIAPFRVVYVDVNGNDNVGDGSFYNPFGSIKKGVDVANDISPFNVFVAIGPGTYLIDNPLDLPNNTFLIGWDSDVWVATPINNNTDVFTVANANADVNLIGGAVLGLIATGTGLNQTGIGSTVTFSNFVMRNLQTGFKISNGAMLCDDVEISELDSISTGFDVSNGAVLSVALNRTIDDATAAILFKVDGSGTILNLSGPTIVDSINVTTFLKIDNGAFAEVLSAVVDGPTTGVELDNASAISSVGSTFRNTTTDINVLDTASILNFVGAKLDKNKLVFPDGFKNENMLFQDNTEDEEATKIYGDLFVGRPENGTVLCTGEGEPSTRGMEVLTTDDTATSTTDGGNFIDVTAAAKSPSGSTFSFQGVTADHTILLASTLNDGTDLIKHPGVFILQTTAAVEVTPKSFVFEYWDGAAWETIAVMSIEEVMSYRYGNEVFIRANTREHIRYNNDINSSWTKKTINGTNAFWSRIRIATTVTTAPVFEQFRLHANFGEFADDGYSRYYGRGRFRQTLLAAGNVYSETGGIANFNLPIGSGGLPTGWTHRGNNQQFNGNGDAIYMQFVLPRGIDTSSSMEVAMYYIPEQAGPAGDASFIIGALPIESQGVLEADPTGGTTPVERTLANTVTVTANAGQATTISTPVGDNTRIQRIVSDPVDISDFYEGDMMFIRIEMDDDGTDNQDVFALSVEINGVVWALGERLA